MTFLVQIFSLVVSYLFYARIFVSGVAWWKWWGIFLLSISGTSIFLFTFIILSNHGWVYVLTSYCFLWDLSQASLPPHLEEYQRLRCRVAFHALRFRQEVQELATRILRRSVSTLIATIHTELLLAFQMRVIVVLILGYELLEGHL